MTTSTIQIYGRLGRAPEQRTTATGKAMTTATMVVGLGRDGDMPEWFSLAAFGTIGEALAKHGKGDMVSISGRLTKSAWTGRDGAERSGFSLRARARCGRGRHLTTRSAPMRCRLMTN